MSITEFSQLPISTELKKALAKMNFEKPTEIQAAAIPKALEGHDLLATAQTGCGKTAAFLIPALSKGANAKTVVLAPTRELAQQIHQVAIQLVAFQRNYQVALIVGGADIRRQIFQLKKNPGLIIATPGRLFDHIQRRTVNLSQVQTVVLDEGDRMLDMGFQPQIDAIFEHLPDDKQVLLFTATLPKKVMELARRYMENPVSIQVGPQSQPMSSIDQKVIAVDNTAEKSQKLVDELNTREGSVVVFIKTQRDTEAVFENLKSYGFSAGWIHGGRSQGQRNRVIKDFKEGRCRILCATDVAARGLDIPHIEHVINYDIPTVDEDYVHRIGRTGRNGKTGQAVSFVTRSEARTWNVIVKRYKIKDGEIFVERGSRPKAARGAHGGGGFGGGRNRSGSPFSKRRDGSERRAPAQSASGGGRKPFFGAKLKGSEKASSYPRR